MSDFRDKPLIAGEETKIAGETTLSGTGTATAAPNTGAPPPPPPASWDPAAASNRSPARRLLSRFFREPIVVLATALILTLIALALIGPKRLTGYHPTDDVNYEQSYQSPNPAHRFGTDNLGRDLAARMIAGAQISLRIALVAALINLVIGVTWGAVAGWAGGRVDNFMMRIVDVLYGVPTILVVIFLMVYTSSVSASAPLPPDADPHSASEAGIRNIYLAIGLTYWLNMARLVRGEVLSLKTREYVLAARALGAGPIRIIARHIVPNCAGVILVTVTLFIPEAIFTEAFLSYIGLGVPAPDASWGSLAADGARNLRSYPYLLLFPAAAICITMLAFNVLGDWLRDQAAGDS